jgi:hypothetical protein
MAVRLVYIDGDNSSPVDMSLYSGHCSESEPISLFSYFLVCLPEK